MQSDRARRLLAAVVAMLAATTLTACGSRDTGTPVSAKAPSSSQQIDDSSRQSGVRERGDAVMPFDLDATHHTFDKTETGGVQTVTVNDPGDTKNLQLVRSHLAEIATAFSAGRYDDPSTIHGTRMSGLQVLKNRYDEVTDTYEDIEDGGKVTYSARDPELIAAIHQFFDAQLTDHGHDASSMVTMTPEMMCAHHPDLCPAPTSER